MHAEPTTLQILQLLFASAFLSLSFSLAYWAFAKRRSFRDFAQFNLGYPVTRDEVISDVIATALRFVISAELAALAYGFMVALDPQEYVASSSVKTAVTIALATAILIFGWLHIVTNFFDQLCYNVAAHAHARLERRHRV